MELKPARYSYGKMLHNVLIPTQEDFDAIDLFTKQLNSNKIPSKTFRHDCKLPVGYFRKHTGMTMSKKSNVLIIESKIPQLQTFSLKDGIYVRDYSGNIKGYFIEYVRDYNNVAVFLDTIKALDYNKTSIFTPKGFMEAYCITETTEQELETFNQMPASNYKLRKDLLDALDPRKLTNIHTWLTGNARRYDNL